jgi:hypothetical protein
MPCSEVVQGPLLLKDSATDSGTRPFADGDNEPYWNSPSIRLVGGVDDGTAKVGAANTIVITVTNMSQSTTLNNINIEAWVCNFTMGVSPASSLASSNPNGDPMTGFFAGPLPPGGQHDVSATPWTPTQADAALNGGHVCIAANCYADNDGAALGVEGNVFKFLCDTHHGQRNIHVAVVPGGQQHFRFPMQVANPNPRLGALTHVMIQHVVGTRAFTDVIRGQLLATPGVTYGVARRPAVITGLRSQVINSEVIAPVAKLATAGPGVVHELAHLTPPAVAAAGLAAAPRNQFFLQVAPKQVVPLAFSPLLPQAMTISAAGVGAGHMLNFNLAEGHKATMEVDIELPAGARPGDMHAFDLTQHSPQGDVLGGARIVLVFR